MASLFVIGNGFDLDHNLPTSYEHFHNYLKETYQANESYPIIPTWHMGKDGDTIYDTNEVVSFILSHISNIVGDNWRDIESSLGELNYDIHLGDFPLHYDKDGDPDLFKNANSAEDISDGMIRLIDIHEYLADWVNTIKISSQIKPKRDFAKLIGHGKTYFLTFNYTPTIEVVYGKKNVCHIHGEQGYSLIFGHGDTTNHSDHYETHYTGAEQNLCAIDEGLRKNTALGLERLETFLPKNISKIYSYGFSFSEVDLIYIKRICERLDTSCITWYLNNYDKEHHSEYKKLINDSGFEGIFSKFTIKH